MTFLVLACPNSGTRTRNAWSGPLLDWKTPVRFDGAEGAATWASPAADDIEEIIGLSDQHAWLELRRSRTPAEGMDLEAWTEASGLRRGGWTGAPLPMESTKAAS